MSEYSDVAKQLGIKFRIGRYGMTFLQRDPTGKIYELMSIVRLDGWEFDPHKIVEAIANDPDWRIRYAGTEVSDLVSPDSEANTNLSEESTGQPKENT